STTRWTLIARAQGNSDEARMALAELCRAYWPPIYAFVRRTHDAETARDRTQGFFAQFLERKLVQRPAPERGPFRSFLLTAVENYLPDQKSRQAALKRGGGALLLPLDADDAEERYVLLAASTETPERAFERAWAVTVMGRAMARLEAEQVDEGKGER